MLGEGATGQGSCTNSISYRRNGVGTLCLELALSRGEEREVVFILGFAEDKAVLRDEIAPYLKPRRRTRPWQG